MIVEKDFRRLLSELTEKESAIFTLSGTAINVRAFDQGSKLALGAVVYQGGNYIPKSVRRCLEQKPPFKPSSIKTFLKLDEDSFQISLQYLGHIHEMTARQFEMIIEEFGWLVEEWRLFLDEHDKNDLVHINVK